MEVNEHFERLSLTYPYLGLGVQDDFCIQLKSHRFLITAWKTMTFLSNINRARTLANIRFRTVGAF
uniref:Uncharacterized protein n=1 Tax=Candidatus Kentrum sp. FM TaxID=2126340 RepID=A0A450TZ31_9GAMM|nr:MAG: hypothetical protein BECKFM1743C_GA0114222_108251 [Candidatus Kentron sp. FM]VFJ76631.1 MAG: hypothetical protein BECKFM1743A_GA0114220_109361 [Candidatus Kentron sp. FM]